MKWEKCSIGALVDRGDASIQTGPFGTQLKAKDYVSSGTPVINVRNIGFGQLRDEKLEYVGSSTAEKLAMHLLQPGDIVFGRKGAVERHLYVDQEQQNWMQGSDCIRLRFLDKSLESHFVSYCFLSVEHQQWMLTQAGNKATMASLNQDIIRRIQLWLPPVTVQKKIIDVLKTYDDLIENNRRRIALLEESARLLYQEWFVRLRFPGCEHTRIVDGVPEGWEKTFATEVIDFDPPTKVAKDRENWFVEMSCLSGGSMVIADVVKRFGNSGSKFQNGDTLFARITPCLENGKTGYVNFLPDDDVGVGSTEFIVMRGTRVSPEFVYCFARSRYVREKAIKSMIGASGRQRVQKSCFNDILVPLPHKRIAQQFDEIVRPLFSQIRALDKQNIYAKQARDLLLPKLMSGEVMV